MSAAPHHYQVSRHAIPAEARRGRPTEAELEAERQAHPTQRFTLADMPAWGPWLLDRLRGLNPELRREIWPSRINGWMTTNDHLFVRNERAVLLAWASPRVLDGKIVVQEVFAWSRDAKPSVSRAHGLAIEKADPAARYVVLLYRHLREWARAQHAERLFVGQCSDMLPSNIMETLSAERCGWISVPL